MRHLPDGRFLAASAANGVLLLDGQTGHFDLLGRHLIRLTPGISYGEFPTVSTLTLSRDGRLLATGGHEDRPTIRVWDLTTRRQVHKLQHPAGHDVFGLAFSPDGTQLVSGAYWDEDGGGACCVWELATPASDRSHQN
jgi:WD40 repeat protein